jgi:Ca-activated chloride channel family protein
MRRRMIVLAAGLAVIAWNVHGQSVRSLISDGNSAYREQRYADAEARYREALQEEQGLLPGHFNLGNALERQGRYDEALRQFEMADASALETATKAHARYNKGNTLFDAGQYREAADAFIESLKIDPNDQDAKFNLSLALKKLQEQQQQQDKNKDKNKDQDKNQQKKDQQQDQDKNDQQKKDQQQDQRQKPEPQDQERQQASSPREKSMSKADAERILEVLRNSEKDIQKKLRARQATRPKTDKDW